MLQISAALSRESKAAEAPRAHLYRPFLYAPVSSTFVSPAVALTSLSICRGGDPRTRPREGRTAGQRRGKGGQRPTRTGLSAVRIPTRIPSRVAVPHPASVSRPGPAVPATNSAPTPTHRLAPRRVPPSPGKSWTSHPAPPKGRWPAGYSGAQRCYCPRRYAPAWKSLFRQGRKARLQLKIPAVKNSDQLYMPT